MKDKGSYRIPLQNVAYLLYHVAKSEIYDPEIFQRFEVNLAQITNVQITSRHCMGALYAYYKSNQGS